MEPREITQRRKGVVSAVASWFDKSGVKSRTLVFSECGSQLQPNRTNEDLGSKGERLSARKVWVYIEREVGEKTDRQTRGWWRWLEQRMLVCGCLAPEAAGN